MHFSTYALNNMLHKVRFLMRKEYSVLNITTTDCKTALKYRKILKLSRTKKLLKQSLTLMHFTGHPWLLPRNL